ncbi:MAG: carbon storage regulator, partial [Thermoguttaceae bacterium]|nr:carbon storage regulator [Thermoguttaceae bacterium]
NGNITIVVVDVRGDKARIGIEAPADVAVYRSEILAKSAAANGGDSAAQDGGVGVSETASSTAPKRRATSASGRPSSTP